MIKKSWFKHFGLLLATTCVLFAVGCDDGAAQSSVEPKKNEESLSQDSSAQCQALKSVDKDAFLQAAFSDKMWNEDLPPDHYKNLLKKLKAGQYDVNHGDNKKYYERLKQNNRWYGEYMFLKNGFFEDGLHERNVINKWSSKVKIGVGWPSKIDANNPVPSDPHVDIAAKKIKALIPAIEKATGLQIKYTEDDVTNGIRVIPLQSWRPRSDRSDPTSRATDFQGGAQWEEIQFWNAVLYETSENSVMDAYFIPNERNDLELAICKINTKIDDSSFEKLITECLVRSLGLPSKITNDQGKSVLSITHADLGSGVKNKKSGDISDQDLNLISALYCPTIKQGMSKDNILTLLKLERK